METKTPVILSIDVEPDERAMDPGSPVEWRGFEEIASDLDRHRCLLEEEEATGSVVRFSWFLRMDPQVRHVFGSTDWVATRYEEQIRGLLDAGDEVGLHIHPFRWDPESGWVVDFEDVAWGEACVEEAFTAFEERFGRRCEAVRFGDRWLNDSILATAARMGALYDLTSEPGHAPMAPPENSIGLTPDYSANLRNIYRPSRRDIRRSAGVMGRRLWMIPVSTGEVGWALEEAERHGTWDPPLVKTSESNGYQGWVERIDERWVEGWVCDTRFPDRIIEVDVYDEQRCLGRWPASLFRPDLVEAGMGHGCHAFRFPLLMGDGGEHTINVRAAGTAFELNGGPLVVQAGEVPETRYQSLDLGADASLISYLIDHLLVPRDSDHLSMVVRSSASATPSMRANLERTLQHLARHSPANGLEFVTPRRAVLMATRRPSPLRSGSR